MLSPARRDREALASPGQVQRQTLPQIFDVAVRVVQRFRDFSRDLHRFLDAELCLAIEFFANRRR
jgi:hypothetical protein